MTEPRPWESRGATSTSGAIVRPGVNAPMSALLWWLTLLVPDIIEAILDRRQPAELQLRNLLAGFPLEWKR